jgi:uncharacterized membrane protein YphA (DoxX/SURF4 family)
MPELLTGPHAVLFARIFIAIVLIIAASGKIIRRREFIEIIRNYGLLPAGLATVVGHFILIVEPIIALSLLSGLLIPWSAIAATLLFITFASAIAINLLRGRREISCGCFSINGNQALSWILVMRNIGLAALACCSAPFWSASVEVNHLSILDMVSVWLTTLAVFGSFWLWTVITSLWRMNDFSDR